VTEPQYIDPAAIDLSQTQWVDVTEISGLTVR